MDGALVKGKKLGQGGYGTVYSAFNSEGQEFALKRNMVDNNISFCGMIRELDILIKCHDHPYIANLVGTRSGENIFSNGIFSPRKGQEKNDRVHLLFEKMNCDLHSLIHERKSRVSYYDLRHIMCDILLAMEYSHAKNVIHRDLKPANILILENEGKYSVQIGDWGMSKPYTNQEVATPGTSTYPYRAPEGYHKLLSSREYPCIPNSKMNVIGKKSDVWSLGCIFFEMISKRHLVEMTGPGADKMNPRDIDLIGQLIVSLEEEPTQQELLEISVYPPQGPLPSHWTKKLSLRKRRKNLDYLSQLNIDDKGNFESQVGPVGLFCDLLRNMLKFDQNKRFSITECLNHEFFSCSPEYVNYIDEMRTHLPQNYEIPILKIHRNNERQWMHLAAINVYNRKCEYANACVAKGIQFDKNKTITDRELFQAISLFDRYLDFKVQKGHDANAVQTEFRGLYHDKKEVLEIFWSCLYISKKYFLSLGTIPPLKEFLPDYISNHENIGDIELELFSTAFDWDIYQDTIFEAPGLLGEPMVESDQRHLFVMYLINVNIPGMNIYEAYNYYKKELRPQLNRIREAKTDENEFMYLNILKGTQSR